MWVKRAHKNNLQEDFTKTILVEKDTFCLKYNPYIQIDQPFASCKKHDNFLKHTTQNKDPLEMNHTKNFLQKISNDMVDLKKTNL